MLWSHANSAVPDREPDLDPLVGILFEDRAHHHFALVGKLDCVVDQIDQDLSQPQRIANQVRRNVVLLGDQKLQVLLLRLLVDDRRKIRQHIFHPEVGLLDIQLAGLDLGEVEDVVDDAEQRLRRRLDLGEIVLLLAGQVGLKRKVSEPDHCVHRRAYLVAHVGEKIGLGLGRRLGHLFRTPHLIFRLLAVGDVLDVGNHQLTVHVLCQKDRDLNVEDLAGVRL